jgi:hypothetical protein
VKALSRWTSLKFTEPAKGCRSVPYLVASAFSARSRVAESGSRGRRPSDTRLRPSRDLALGPQRPTGRRTRDRRFWLERWPRAHCRRWPNIRSIYGLLKCPQHLRQADLGGDHGIAWPVRTDAGTGKVTRSALRQVVVTGTGITFDVGIKHIPSDVA